VIIAATLSALIIALLAIPFEVIFKIQRDEGFRSNVTLNWLFGVVRFTIPDKSAQKPDKKSRKIKTTKKANKKPANAQAIKDLLWNARFRYRMFKFVKDVFKSIHIANFYMRIRLGLDDPADTGRLWAYFGPLAVFLSNLSHATVHLEPDFQTEIVYLDSSGKVRIVPLQVLFTVFAFLLSPITISALLAMRKSRKK
jgi:hypothetical protein